MWYHRQELPQVKTWSKQNLEDGKYIVQMEFVPTVSLSNTFDFYCYGIISVIQILLGFVI